MLGCDYSEFFHMPYLPIPITITDPIIGPDEISAVFSEPTTRAESAVNDETTKEAVPKLRKF